MMEPLLECAVDCPYCGAQFVALLDTSEGDAEYIQDCEVCCQPIRFEIAVDFAGGVSVTTTREDDA